MRLVRGGEGFDVAAEPLSSMLLILNGSRRPDRASVPSPVFADESSTNGVRHGLLTHG
jgi:hypothetical protein